MLDMLLLAQSVAPTPSTPTDLKIWAYAAFIGLVVVLLALDLGVFHREAHEVTFRESLLWSVVWVTLGVAFAGAVFMAYERQWLGLGTGTPMYNPLTATDPAAPLIVTGTVAGAEAVRQYLVGYVVEKSLAMDNIFIIAMIFSFFAIPAKYQHRVLFWGIIGALLMRGGMIMFGGELIMRYQWVLIVFGVFLVLTALKMALIKGNDDVSQNIVVRWIKRFYPVTDFYDGQRFFTRRTVRPTYSIDPKSGREVMDPPPPGSLGRRAITPLFLALVMVEITDLIFAVDSIPAIFAITPDPFIVFTSNIFAILGLRSLYFCLAALVSKFRFLKPALILILAFVGVKLLLLATPPYLDDIAAMIGMRIEPMRSIKVPTGASLIVVVATLGLATLLSILVPSRHSAAERAMGKP